MFTGIIEKLGEIKDITKKNDNIHIAISCDFVDKLKIGQSVSHNGVCLTIVNLKGGVYTTTVIKETIEKTSLKNLNIGDFVNLERAMKLGDRFDGHIVQGHVDYTAECISIKNKNGSHIFSFKHDESKKNITVEKGSITIDGVSLTVVESEKNEFSVAIIPFTYENTNFHSFMVGTLVNLEFDIIGKYVSKLMNL